VFIQGIESYVNSGRTDLRQKKMTFPVSNTAHMQCHNNEMHGQQNLIFTIACYAVGWHNGYHFKYTDILLIYSISAALTSLNSMILFTCYLSQYFLTLTGYWLTYPNSLSLKGLRCWLYLSKYLLFCNSRVVR